MVPRVRAVPLCCCGVLFASAGVERVHRNQSGLGELADLSVRSGAGCQVVLGGQVGRVWTVVRNDAKCN